MAGHVAFAPAEWNGDSGPVFFLSLFGEYNWVYNQPKSQLKSHMSFDAHAWRGKATLVPDCLLGMHQEWAMNTGGCTGTVGSVVSLIKVATSVERFMM